MVDIFPSIMCAKTWDKNEYIKKFDEVPIKSIHYDVMDGHYVPNVMLGTAEFNDIHSISKLPIDVHLMVENPNEFVEFFNFNKNDYCCFHPECVKDPRSLLIRIKEKGVKAGLAISPWIDLKVINECLDKIDYILFMSINPGVHNDKIMDGCAERLATIKEMCEKADHKIEIVVDGKTNVENSKMFIKNGATGLVAGTSYMIKDGPDKFIEYYNKFMSELLKNE